MSRPALLWFSSDTAAVLGACCAAALGLAWAARWARRSARGARVPAGAWLAGPLGVVGAGLVWAGARWAAQRPDDWRAAAAELAAGDVALGAHLLAAALLAAVSTAVPGWAWRRTYRPSTLGDRDAGRAASLALLAGAAVALAVGGTISPWALVLAPALLAAALAPARAALPGAGQRPDLRRRGAEGDRAAFLLAATALLASGGAAALLGRGMATRESLWAPGTLSLGGPSAAAATAAGLGLLTLAAAAGFHRLVGAAPGVPRRPAPPRPRVLALGAGVCAVSLLLSLRLRLSAPLDLAPAVSEAMDLDDLPLVPARFASALQPVAAVDPAGAPLLIRDSSWTLDGAEPWVSPHSPRPEAAPESWTALSRSEAALRLALGGHEPASVLSTAPLFARGQGTVHLVSRVQGEALDGGPLLVEVPLGLFTRAGLQAAQEHAQPGPLPSDGCVSYARPAPVLPLPTPEDAVLRPRPDETVAQLVARCLAARASGAERCVVVPSGGMGLAATAPAAFD